MVEVHFTPWKEIHPSPLWWHEMTVWCRDDQKVKVLAVILRECVGKKREGKQREQVSQHIVLHDLNMGETGLLSNATARFRFQR